MAASSFNAVYQTANGIGGYDLRSAADRIFAFDYDHSSRLDHLVIYRPSTGMISILSNKNSQFNAVYSSSLGIGGYDLRGADQAFAFDYDHSGKLDHIVLFRPGTGLIWILKNDGGSFTAVYAQSNANGGIGGYDLASGADRAVAFDYDHSGKRDHLVLYRPTTGMIWILKNRSGIFTAVYAQSNPGTGIGGYDLKSGYDRIIPFDFDNSGKLDHLVLFRPATGIIWILRNSQGSFIPVFASAGQGIGGYSLTAAADDAFAFDFGEERSLNHLVFYRPGTGIIYILSNRKGSFIPVSAQNSGGIGGYDLLSAADIALAFDYEQTGLLDHIVIYRPGHGILTILKHDNRPDEDEKEGGQCVAGVSLSA